MHMMSILSMKILTLPILLVGLHATAECGSKFYFTDNINECTTRCGEVCPDFGYMQDQSGLVFLKAFQQLSCPGGEVKQVCRPVQFHCDSGAVDARFGEGCVSQCMREPVCPVRSKSIKGNRLVYYGVPDDGSFFKNPFSKKTAANATGKIVSSWMSKRMGCPVEGHSRVSCPFTKDSLKNLKYEMTGIVENEPEEVSAQDIDKEKNNSALNKFKGVFKTKKKKNKEKLIVQQNEHQRLPDCGSEDPLNTQSGSVKCKTNCKSSCPASMKKFLSYDKEKNARHMPSFVHMITTHSYQCASVKGESDTDVMEWHVCEPVAYVCNKSKYFDDEYGNGCISECLGDDDDVQNFECNGEGKAADRIQKKKVGKGAFQKIHATIKFEKSTALPENVFEHPEVKKLIDNNNLCNDPDEKVAFCSFDEGTKQFYKHFRTTGEIREEIVESEEEIPDKDFEQDFE